LTLGDLFFDLGYQPLYPAMLGIMSLSSDAPDRPETVSNVSPLPSPVSEG
jgi:hypothetical protein